MNVLQRVCPLSTMLGTRGISDLGRSGWGMFALHSEISGVHLQPGGKCTRFPMHLCAWAEITAPKAKSHGVGFTLGSIAVDAAKTSGLGHCGVWLEDGAAPPRS